MRRKRTYATVAGLMLATLCVCAPRPAKHAAADDLLTPIDGALPITTTTRTTSTAFLEDDPSDMVCPICGQPLNGPAGQPLNGLAGPAAGWTTVTEYLSPRPARSIPVVRYTRTLNAGTWGTWTNYTTPTYGTAYGGNATWAYDRNGYVPGTYRMGYGNGYANLGNAYGNAYGQAYNYGYANARATGRAQGGWAGRNCAGGMCRR